jgi:hypothetical protein
MLGRINSVGLPRSMRSLVLSSPNHRNSFALFLFTLLWVDGEKCSLGLDNPRSEININGFECICSHIAGDTLLLD